MAVAVLYPRFDHPAIEERYASWQTQMLLRAGCRALCFFEADDSAARAAHGIEEDLVLVVTDPILLPPPNLPERLATLLADSRADAVVPISNEAANEHQRRGPDALYLTLREFQLTTAAMQAKPAATRRVTWDDSDPAAFLCRTELLTQSSKPIAQALAGREVVISDNDYMHRWSSLRGQIRMDLLAQISTEAKSILEFGCGEAPLGEALKKRQKCRVVGIELDPKAAVVARRRIDDVYCGDVRHLVNIINEEFDWIIGGDIIEHLDEPWTFLDDLRRIAKPGAHLLLSLPNIANASLVSDLLRGRFDYVYMGLTCVGHLRFFTRQSIEDMLTIAGWSVVGIAPQPVVPTPGAKALLAALERAGAEYSKDDLLAPGYYVTARNS
jgi:2-polyprenyl-3-methyl-5-hydroxy-6-metoxy-1,4-benzoquinol methylase